MPTSPQPADATRSRAANTGLLWSTVHPVVAVPASVRHAVHLMLAGAAWTVLTAIPAVVTSLTPTKTYSWGPAERDRPAELLAVVIPLAAAALWCWLAVQNGRGQRWARVVATALFALSVVGFLSIFPRFHVADFVSRGVSVFVGLAVTILLWAAESSAFYEHAAERRAAAGQQPTTWRDPSDRFR